MWPRESDACHRAVLDRAHHGFSRDAYVETVQSVIDLMLAGDIFQANIAQRLTARFSSPPYLLAFYCRLRALNPTPFAALLRYGKRTIASSSPERFLRLDGRYVGQARSRAR